MAGEFRSAPPVKLPFELDDRVILRLDFDLAIRIGELILSISPEDTQLLALAHRLVNLDDQPSFRKVG